MRRMMRGRKVTNCTRAWEYPAWLHFMAQITLNKNKISDYFGGAERAICGSVVGLSTFLLINSGFALGFRELSEVALAPLPVGQLLLGGQWWGVGPLTIKRLFLGC